MKVRVDPWAPGRCSSAEAIATVAARSGLVRLDETQITQAHALAHAALGDGVASEATFAAVQRHVGAAVFGYFDEGALSGVLASFPLNEAGHHALRSGVFDTVNVDLSGLCKDGEAPDAYYGWGFVATTPKAGIAVVRASGAIYSTLFWNTPTYARAVTAAGKRALLLLGARPTDWGDASILEFTPLTSRPGRST